MDADRDMAVVLGLYEEVLRIRKNMLDHPKPGNGNPSKRLLLKIEMAEEYTLVGATIYRLGDYSRALPYFQNALDLRRELLATYLTSPDLAGMTENERRQRYSVSLSSDLSRSLLGVGDVRFRLGDKDTGHQLVDEAVALREKLHKENPNSRPLKWELARTGGFYADKYVKDVVAARKQLERARQLMQELADQDPNNVHYRRDLGSMYYRLGRLELRAKNDSAARQHFAQSQAIREAQAAADPSNSRYQI